MSRLTIIGIGPGSAEYFMPAARNRMREVHTVIAARRILPMLREICGDVETEFLPMGKIKDTLESELPKNASRFKIKETLILLTLNGSGFIRLSKN
mgnify:CR=1 FL=1